jgi:hypothetical protein
MPALLLMFRSRLAIGTCCCSILFFLCFLCALRVLCGDGFSASRVDLYPKKTRKPDQNGPFHVIGTAWLFFRGALLFAVDCIGMMG